MGGAAGPAARTGTSHRLRPPAPHRGVQSGLVGRTRVRLDAQGDAPRRLRQRRPSRRRSRTGGLAHLRWRLRRRRDETASPARCAPGNPNCSPTSTSGSPTVPPKAQTGSSMPSNAKDSATPTPRTTAGASSTAAHDTLNPPDNRTPLPHQTRRANKPTLRESQGGSRRGATCPVDSVNEPTQPGVAQRNRRLAHTRVVGRS